MRLVAGACLIVAGSLIAGCTPSDSKESNSEYALRQSRGIGVIHGRVMQADGRPCAKAILLFGHIRSSGIEYNDVETDANGLYVFDPKHHGYTGGKYAVAVAKGFGCVKTVVPPRLVQLDLSRPQKSIDFTVPESSAWVEGVTRDSAGKPVPNVGIHVPDVAARGAYSLVQGYSDAQGRFRLEAPAGGPSVIDVILFSNMPRKSNPKPINPRPGETVQMDLAIRQ